VGKLERLTINLVGLFIKMTSNGSIKKMNEIRGKI
jgi:hypothetical protein